MAIFFQLLEGKTSQKAQPILVLCEPKLVRPIVEIICDFLRNSNQVQEPNNLNDGTNKNINNEGAK